MKKKMTKSFNRTSLSIDFINLNLSFKIKMEGLNPIVNYKFTPPPIKKQYIKGLKIDIK